MAYAIIATKERRKKDFQFKKELKPESQTRVNKFRKSLKPESQTRVNKFRKSLKKDKIEFKQISIPSGITMLPESLLFQLPANSIENYKSETPLEVFIW